MCRYTLLGTNTVTVPSSATVHQVIDYEVPMIERIYVKQGDVIALVTDVTRPRIEIPDGKCSKEVNMK